MGFEYVYFAIIFFIAGIAPELTGFGVATISMALLPFLLPLSVAIPLVAIISTTATGIVALRTKTGNLFKYIRPLLVGSAIGVALGMVFLRLLDEQLLTVVLGIFLVIYALYGLFFKGHFLPTGNVTGTVTGLVAGFFGASFNVHGPLVGLYSSSNGDLSKTEIKDLMATYMFFTGLFTIVGHAISGRMSGEILVYALFALPFLLVGLAVGKRIFRKVNIVWIKRGIYLFVLAAGIAFLL
ncbi:MAG: hypothetical protein COU08_04500 [Candidatus Harrisonbacteria bacterium CG10_big_fil_rev_8_21_14_0_10_42_17]|uniref:Probable membrane transporter protein n=1 Tax=Candidatus Harrisonbacteria bacterium CG10_big_fil_rev_8_21_14_0_10_42_17 TaxID=1974584 RepID=A0A2M6WH84_9BACT|nr:MAG: hypothetical protein COU08_04500 [Candidatus Harrisonbacteria bacterium CG10_big_fil_rev_8_21_14_0_10_42_17]